MKTLLNAIIALSLLLSAQLANAVAIDGSVSFIGGFKPTPEGNLIDATGIDFFDLDDFMSGGDGFGTSGGTLMVAPGITGDFASYLSPLQLGTINDFNFDASFTPVVPLWEVGGFKFDLTSVNAVPNSSGTTLTITGYGEIYGNGFDRTAGAWLMTANSDLGSTSFSWSASVSSVSESGSLALLAIGLLGLGFYRRK